MTTAPNGASYSVTRRWLPWRRKAKDLDLTPSDLPGGDLGGDGDAFVIFLAFIALLLLAPVIALALIVTLELLLLLLLLPFYVAARALFGVSWEVEVRHRSGLVWPVVHTENVRGWGESGRRINEIATAIRDGQMTLRRETAESE